VRPTSNFVSGGPLRALMHVVFNTMSEVANSESLFSNAVEMLRYLMLRERSRFFTEVIRSVFGEQMLTSQCKVYSLFNRAHFVKEMKRSTRDADIKLDSRVQQENSSRPIFDLIKCEIKIYTMTIEGVLSSSTVKQI
jgi:hypothetical protein